jgi:hypothetical protein
MGLAFFYFCHLLLHINITAIVLFRSLARYRIFVGTYCFPHLTKY